MQIFPSRAICPLLALSLLAAACTKSEPPAQRPATPAAPTHPALPVATTLTAAEDPVLATVNGTPVTMADVRLSLRLTKDDQLVEEAKLDPVLDTLIRQEIVAQAAAAAKLDQGVKYLEGYAKVAAPLNAYRRRALGDAWFQAEVAKLPPITDAEAQAYFDANKETLTNEFHLEQLMVREPAKAAQMLKDVRAGKSLREVYLATNPDTAARESPWDVGWMPWQLVPEQWKPVLAKLKLGETSDLIAGANKRFWIIRLVEKRPSKFADFAAAKAGILQHLTDVRAEEARGRLGDELVSQAKIIRHKPAAKPGNAPELEP
jgi:peptidyl-prolyl cis-trans isomerase C